MKRSVSSASEPGVRGMRPVADTESLGEAASISTVITVLRMASRPVTSPIPSSLTNRSLTPNRTSYLGSSKRPLPDAVKSVSPESGACGYANEAIDSTGTRCPETLKEYVPAHAT